MPILWPQFWMRIIIKQPFSQRTRISRKCCCWAVVSISFHPICGEDEPLFDEHIFFKGLVRFNHQLGPRLVGCCQVAGPEAFCLFLQDPRLRDSFCRCLPVAWAAWYGGWNMEDRMVGMVARQGCLPKTMIWDRIKGELKSGSWRIQKKRAGVQKWHRNIYTNLRPCDQMKQVHSEKK